MAGLIQKGARRFTTQIGAAGVADAVTTTIPLVSVTGLPTDTTIEITVDRTDASGNLTPNKEEVIRGTVSGLNLINCTRGVEGTAQAHSAGAVVNSLLTASMWNQTSQYLIDLPKQGLIGGYFTATVASNNLTIAVKTLAGNDPSVNEPVEIWIPSTAGIPVRRLITSALSSTMPAGFNAFNSGSSELATREIDYFVYIGLKSTGNLLAIGFSRIPYANLGGNFDFSSVANEKYGRFTDTSGAVLTTGEVTTVVNVGRFAATLSASASFNWSVPTFTADNLIQRPIFETRWRVWAPTISGSGSMTLSVGTVDYAKYKIVNNVMFISLSLNNYTTGGTASNFIRASLPITQANITGNWRHGATYFVNNGLNTVGQFGFGTSGVIEFGKSDVSNLTLGTGYYAAVNANYEI